MDTSYTKLGEGSYACVVSPALTCNKNNNNGEVSKVFTMDDGGVSFTMDLKLNNEINSILLENGLTPDDIDSHFIIGHECILENTNELYTDSTKINNICHKNIPGNIKKVINFKNGGVSLYEYYINNEIKYSNGSFDIFYSLLNSFLNVFQGIDKLNRNGIYHMDLKPQNLLIDEDNIIRISDFGNTLVESNITEDYKYETHIVSPGYKPPELFTLVNGALYVFTMYLGSSSVKNVKNIDTINSPDKFQTYFLSLNLTNKQKYEKVDVFSLGIMIMELLSYFNHYSDYNIITKNMIEKTNELVDKLTKMNPRERPNSSEALALYNDFLSEIDSIANGEVGGKRQIYKKSKKHIKHKKSKKTIKHKKTKKHIKHKKTKKHIKHKKTKKRKFIN
jgi:serine/threonine protein kinase